MNFRFRKIRFVSVQHSVRSTAVALLFIVSGLVQAASVIDSAAIDDGYFGWDGREISLDDARAAIRQFPKLAPHEALIVDRCGLHSINPRLAALLLDASGTLHTLNANTQAAEHEQVGAFLTALPHMFYLGRSKATGARPLHHDLRDSGVPGVAETAGVTALAETFLSGNERLKSLGSQYLQRFGTRTPIAVERMQQKAGDVTTSANPPNLMRLPWLLGQQGWSFNGVHSSSGSCSAQACGQPRSSIDFSNGWPVWGTNTTRSPVLAAIDGTVTIYSSCNLRVTNANGWAANYYHLDKIRVTNGSTVAIGQNLADYADNMAQALCTGGGSTGPHVHFTLISGGAQVNIDQSDFSGWKVNATNVIADYDSNCSRMYFTRDGNTTCAYNNGVVPSAWAMHTLATGMASSKQCDLDVDGNGAVAAATDGVLLMRYLLGLRGPALIDGAVGAGATRSNANDIEAFLASKRYDFDGDNTVLSHVDGLLAVRLMRNATGTGLSGSATTTSSILTTGAAIAALAAGCR
jgi:LasA protease